jgi:hypothetical protein
MVMAAMIALYLTKERMSCDIGQGLSTAAVHQAHKLLGTVVLVHGVPVCSSWLQQSNAARFIRYWYNHFREHHNVESRMHVPHKLKYHLSDV